MKTRHSLRLSRLSAALALAVAALPALAQQDPPTRAGRIAYASGAVSFSPAGSDSWAQAPLNRPLVAGDRLWTEPGARDEAQFGPSIARMDGGTLLSVLAADAGTTQLQLSQGRIDLHVRRVGPGETVEIDTPNLAFVARAPGDYRIVVAPDGSSTDVATLRGSGDVYGDGNAYNLGPGQGYRFAGQALDNLGAVPIQPYDDFDRWALARDQRLDRAQSARFVPADVVGYEDLDDNGAWRVVPDYGTVWVPTRVAADWAPYHDGHWAWIDPWGWTWVDDQPWGYAVSHYGRWANIDNRWAWVPSPQRERPVFAPALVAFVGAALALGAAHEGPGVGWFPLGPREPYRPAYHASPTYITQINISNTTIRPNMLAHDLRDPGALRYANRGVPGALMAMPAAQFAQALPVGRAARVLPPRAAMSAPLMAGPNARPLAQSRIGTAAAHGLPPVGAQQRVVVAHGVPRGMPRNSLMPGGRVAGPVLAQHGVPPGAQAGLQPGREGPVRMLRPAPAVRPGVPPPHGPGGPQFAGRPGAPAVAPGAVPSGRFGPHAPQGVAGLPNGVLPAGVEAAGRHGPAQFTAPGAAAPQFGPGGRPGAPAAPRLAGGGAHLPPASVPYPEHGQRGAGPHPAPGVNPAQASPGPAFAQGRAGANGQPLPPGAAGHAPGRSGMQEPRAGVPEPRPATAPGMNGFAQATPHAPAGRPETMHAQAAPPAHAMPAPRMEAARMEAAHAPASHPGVPEQHMPPRAQVAEASRPAAHAQAAPPHPQPASRPEPPAPHPQPAPRAQPAPPPQAHPHAQEAPHPQPAPTHPQAAAPHPEPSHAPPQQQGKGNGHEGNKDHDHGH